MKNFVQEGNVLEHVLAADVVSGAPVVLPAGIGVATKTGVIGDTVALAVKGVVSLPKKTATAVAIGVKVAWDATPGEITPTLADGTPCGYAAKPAAAGDANIDVQLVYGIDVT